MSSPESHSSLGGEDQPLDLNRNFSDRRTLTSIALSTLTTVVAILACIPLFSVLAMLAWRGGKRLNWAVFTETPPTGFETGGGFGNAIMGTLVMVGIAAVMSVPFGILAAIFLAELGPKSKTATVVRFCIKVLSGFPSILAGVFVYATIVLAMGYSAFAGSIALSVLMLPIVILTAEEAMKMVPARMKEAAAGMGCTRTQVVWKIVLPTALPGMLTGVMLAVARAAGETAPLLFTAMSSPQYWIFEDGKLKLDEPASSLAVLIFNLSSSPYDNLLELAWAAALVLVLIVLFFNIVGQVLSRRKFKI